MKLNIEPEFVAILNEIKSANKSVEEWRAIESCDMFQSEKYCGGFDGVEDEFTFSYYDGQAKEFWFEISIEEVEEILEGRITQIQVRKPD